MKTKFNEYIIDETAIDKQIECGAIVPVQIPTFATFTEIEKFQFSTEIIKYAKKNNLKQKDIAKIIDVNKSEVSKLFAYNLKEFSQERILAFIQILLKHGASIDMEGAYEEIKKRSSELKKYFLKKEQLVVGA